MKVTFTASDGKTVVKEAEKVLVAVGRAPRTEGIGLEKTKIKPERGYIHVNELMQTDEPGVYAIGDIVAGLPQLAHVGAMAGMVVVAKIAGKYARPVRRNRIPACTYTEPQIGSVGLTEAAAREKGLQVKVGKFPVCRKLEGVDCRLARGVHQGGGGREVRRDSGRPHHRAAGDGADRRGGDGDGTGSHGRRDDVHDPRAPDAVGSHAGRLRKRGGDGDQYLRGRGSVFIAFQAISSPVQDA